MKSNPYIYIEIVYHDVSLQSGDNDNDPVFWRGKVLLLLVPSITYISMQVFIES
jgi:hypothetical protein